MGPASGPDRDVLVALNRAATIVRVMSGAIHEVNNALQVIGGSVELLEQQADLPPAVVRSLDRIKRQGERAAEALAELLAFSKAPLDETCRFSLREVLLRAVALRRYATARHNLTIEVQSGGSELDLVSGNPGLVEQALLNLIINAEQAMIGTAGVIVVRTRAEPARVGVEVVDTGGGLSREAQARLYEPFSSTRPAREGAGLGLWASRVVAESFGGSLEVASSGVGTRAVMWLPRR